MTRGFSADVLRPDHVAEISRRLGALKKDEVYIPAANPQGEWTHQHLRSVYQRRTRGPIHMPNTNMSAMPRVFQTAMNGMPISGQCRA
jgi:hypothetical protein